MGFLGVLRLRGVVARRVGQKGLAVTLGDHRPGSLYRRVRQRGAVRTHVGDVALFIQTLSRSHGHRRRHAELATRFLLEGRCDERRSGTSSIWLGFTGTDLVRRPVEIGTERPRPRFVEHRDILASELTVVAEVATTGEADTIDRNECSIELTLIVTLHSSEGALHVPVARLDERHTFAFPLDDDPSPDTLHTAR